MTLTDQQALELGRKIAAVTFPASEELPDVILESLGRIAFKEAMKLAWQPIESAPKGWVDILVWDGSNICLAWFCDSGSDDDLGWHDSSNRDHDDYAMNPQPTHWMRPEPPQ